MSDAPAVELKAGDRIRVVGWIMLRGLEEGDYRVASIGRYHGQPTYSFTKPRGKRIVAVHFCTSVDGWINPRNQNRIDILP